VIQKTRCPVAASVFVSILLVAGCGRNPAELEPADSQQSTKKKLEIIEVVARPVGGSGDLSLRPAFPGDVVEIAIKSRGHTAAADLSVKMISLAEGVAVATRDVRLNATSAATPSVRFEPSPEWKPGRYLFEISLDGKLAGTQEIEIFPVEMAEHAKP